MSVPTPQTLTWRDGVAVLAIGAFLAFIDPFGAGEDLPLWGRALYWIILVGVGWLVGTLTGATLRRHAPQLPVWGNLGIAGIIAALAVTSSIYAFEAITGPDIPLAAWGEVLTPVLGVTVGVVAVAWLIDRAFGDRPGAITHAPATGAPSARFLERLPAKIKGAVLYAVSSEDHYLRLHTSKGADLILMRLSDAIVELEGLEGAQTHRSWWVARDAVESVRRDGDRVILVLKGGAEAPVSRPNVKPLREAGWF